MRKRLANLRWRIGWELHIAVMRFRFWLERRKQVHDDVANLELWIQDLVYEIHDLQELLRGFDDEIEQLRDAQNYARQDNILLWRAVNGSLSEGFNEALEEV